MTLLLQALAVILLVWIGFFALGFGLSWIVDKSLTKFYNSRSNRRVEKL